ncbi:glycerophosphodiester phosphodiesterase [Streptomyces cinnamoneus]|uniref:Glycerophosphoryl diester phosphodiesterase n=1 Tax=Streptomyces cinnamoneus TaxID=53446 RepID=A0A918THX2_STRCJ|nr:glycerophosphodiester phosphodiesterase [Streptomyces cinnamoneus]GHC50061.1 glycerophosphoryl diester phosphodiesterase [Streptomyces cinnamoneus]
MGRMVTAFTAVAHRGDPYVHRENTLPSIRSALWAGAGAVEIDVRLTADGVPVLLHDATLGRLWGREVALSALTAEQVRSLTHGRVPTLQEALAEVMRPGRETQGRAGREEQGRAGREEQGRAGREEGGGAENASPARLFVDLPDPAAAAAAVAAVRASGAAERAYYCGGPVAMLNVRRADPDAEIALTWTTHAPPRPSLLAEVRPRWLNYRFGLVTPELVARNHADGLLVSAWTADTRRTMRRLLRAGVDSITTNRIGALRSLLPASA